MLFKRYQYKKWQAFILSMTLLVSLLLGVKTESHATEMMDEESTFELQSEAIDETVTVSDTGFMDVDYTPEDYVNQETSNLLRASSIPAKYDGRTAGVVSSVKDQGNYNTCWALSVMSVAESGALSSGLVSSEPDYSEYHLAYFTYHRVNDPLGNLTGDSTNIILSGADHTTLGGTNFSSIFTLASWVGASDETTAPYETCVANKTILASNLAYNDQLHLENAYLIDMENKDAVKKMIMEHGGVVSAINMSTTYMKSVGSEYCMYYNGSSGANHSICIVGWDDNYSNLNFSTTPASNGAWLIKNSWGTGSYAYFWVSYEDAVLSKQTAVVYDFANADNYDYNYQYDGSCGTKVSNCGSNTVTLANVYTAKGSTKEMLEAVAFAVADTGVNYSIQIYKNSPSNDPLGGEPMLENPVTGETSYEGYYTVPLDNGILLSKGENFTVAVTLSSVDVVYWFTDSSYSTTDQNNRLVIQYVNQVSSGQSYYIVNGKIRDLYNATSPCSSRIKAFTKRYETAHTHTYSAMIPKSSALKSAATTSSPALYYYSCENCGAVNNAAGAPTFPCGETLPADITVSYRTHVQTYGWQNYRSNGAMAGTSGESKRLEGIEIKVSGSQNLGITYRTHVQTYGWQDYRSDGTMSGTSGEAKRLEAISIKLTGSDADKYDVYYRVHAQTFGWLGWAKNGENAGTAGLAKRLEGIQILVLKKGETPSDGILGYSYIEYGKVASNGGYDGLVNYATHVQSYGNQSYVYDGSLSGTTGESKRLEAISIRLNNNKIGYSGGITYCTHVQTYGWQGWKTAGAASGTAGESKRLEAIRIKLTGDVAEHYDVYYRVHAQTYGWLGWAKNGECAGTEGYSKRLEAIQIVLLPKESGSPNYLPGNAGTVAYIKK